jgi:thioredoxin 1
MLEVNAANFEEVVLKSELPVLVDFYGVWCGPCRQIAPLLEKLSQEYEGSFKIVKINFDENLALGEQYKLTALPSLLFFKNGEQVESLLGVQTETVLRKTIESLRA